MERSKYARDKILFILGIMGFGSLNFKVSTDIYSHAILYLVPLVAIGYDLYINAYDEGIKRIGAFIRSPDCRCTRSEKKYEIYVTENRGTYTPTANLLFSSAGILMAGVMVIITTGFTVQIPLIQILWFIIGIGVLFLIHIRHWNRIQKFDSSNKPFRKSFHRVRWRSRQ